MMRPDTLCDETRLDLSAYIDDELTRERRDQIEAHLENCSSCTNEEVVLRSVRKLVRVQAVEDVPDLSRQIMARIQAAPSRESGWQQHLRVAAVSAAAAALIVLGASLPFDQRSTDSARASEITEEVRAVARRLHSYRASFEIVERGWHPDVPVRRMTADVDFRAPEDLRLEVRDATEYPSSQWPPNDVTLVATSERSWIEEPSSCPAEALPNCAAPTTWAGVIERRVITNRQPFDGTSALPTDIIVPLETLAGDGFHVLGRDEIEGRAAYRLQLEYRQAVPLIASLEAGGAWREFHPLDQVDLWIDTQTWFPLRYEVKAGSSPDRSLWATRRGLRDQPGTTLLTVQATGFAEPDRFPPTTFRVPASGITRDGGFDDGRGAVGPTPGFVAGLDLYRTGATAEGDRVLTFTNGMEYLKVVRRDGDLSQDILRSAEELELESGTFAYYLPASQLLGRRLEIMTGERIIQMQTNLARDTLLRVADSLDVRGRRAPTLIEKSAGVSLRRIDPRGEPPAFALEPTYLPDGYAPAAGSMATARDGSRSFTIYYRRAEGEFDGLGIRVVQSAPVDFLPPSSEDFIEIQLEELTARWSTERGELEWIDGDVYRAIAVPSADLYTAVRIAESLR